MKGQASVEFLMTYGWAFALILGTIGTLLYSGILDIDVYVEEKCTFFSGIVCVDGVATTSGINLSIQNGLPIDIENIEVYVPDCSATQLNGDIALISGARSNYSVSCGLTQGDVLRSTIVFNYTNPDSGYDHTKIGSLVYKVS